MTNVVIVLIIIGIIFIAFNKTVARIFIGFQNNVFGFKFPQSVIETTRYLIMFFGVVAIVIAVMTFFKRI